MNIGSPIDFQGSSKTFGVFPKWEHLVNVKPLTLLIKQSKAIGHHWLVKPPSRWLFPFSAFLQLRSCSRREMDAVQRTNAFHFQSTYPFLKDAACAYEASSFLEVGFEGSYT